MRRVLTAGLLAVAGLAACAPRSPQPAGAPSAAAAGGPAQPTDVATACAGHPERGECPFRGPADASFPVAAPRITPDATARVASAVGDVLQRALADSAFPGAYAAVGTRDGVIAELGVGRIDWAADAPRPDARTLWDMASLTKVVATTSAMLQLVAAGKVDPEAPVRRYLPEWTGGAAYGDRILVKHLLSHSSGMPSWRPLYKEATNRDEAIALVLATAPDTVPGVRYLYSDLNAILLGRIVEKVSGESLDRYLARHVFGPLGMSDTRYNPPKSELARIAPTEQDPWRQRHLRGEVHDENAFVLGGVSGHAGLFSTGHDLARLARAYLNGGTLDGKRVFEAPTIARFTRVVDRAVSRRALGWETPTGGNSAGTRLSPRAFGHTGFTGTSIWIDPDKGVFVLLLTNRVNPTRMNTKIGRVRTALADSVIAALDASGALPPAPSTQRP